MGNSATFQKSQKHIVIVGLSFAGLSILEGVWDHFAVTVIDKRDYFEAVPGNIKACVNRNISDDLVLSYDRMVQAYNNKFKFIQGQLEQVNNDNSMEVKNNHGQTQTIKYDYLVICTGFIYEAPVRNDQTLHMDQRKTEHEHCFDQCEKAQNILVVGAGIVGVELAGELGVKYAKEKLKKVTLMASGNRLLPQLPQKAGVLADQYLKAQGVEIIYNTRYSEGMKQQGDYDYVFSCVGQRYNADFLKKNFPQAIAKNGQIYVNDMFQISGTDPKANRFAKPLKDNIFCFGDCTITSLNEPKTIVSLKCLAPILIQNFAMLSQGRQPAYQIPNKIPLVSMLTLGPSYGILVVNGMVSGKEGMAKQKDGMLQANKRMMEGSYPDLVGSKNAIKKLQKNLKCITFCCCCCPCSMCFTPVKKH